MDMTLRWFGEGVDSVALEQIRQIPGVKGVITTLYDIPAGEAWPMERILKMKSWLLISSIRPSSRCTSLLSWPSIRPTLSLM